VHSVAFQILGFSVYWYGILAAAGFLIGFGTASRRGPREGISSEDIINLAPWIIGGAIVGARLLYVITFWNREFAGKPLIEIFNMRTGLVYYGGLIGSSLATVFYCRRHKLDLWKMGDIFAPSVALGHAFGRFGCLMTGCCYGSPTDLPWAIHFPKDHWTRGIGVHPTQVYEAGLNFLLFVGLTWLYRRKKFDGQIFAAYLICYAVLRSLVEIFRGDYEKHYLGGIATPGQTVSILIMAAGLTLWWKRGANRRDPLPGTTSAAP
jgi:phosphatidylglycerol---prolipoprotein diacylglyceryl transferase